MFTVSTEITDIIISVAITLTHSGLYIAKRKDCLSKGFCCFFILTDVLMDIKTEGLT